MIPSKYNLLRHLASRQPRKDIDILNCLATTVVYLQCSPQAFDPVPGLLGAMFGPGGRVPPRRDWIARPCTRVDEPAQKGCGLGMLGT